MTPGYKLAAVAMGAGVGFVLGVTSVGSGALIAVGLILLFRLVPRRVVGTDVFHAAILLWAAGLAQLVAGNVDFVLMVNLLAGSLPGVWIGARLSGRLPERGLRLALATVLLAAGLGLTAKAGADIPAAALVGGPLLAGLVCWIILRARDRRTAPVVPEVSSSR